MTPEKPISPTGQDGGGAAEVSLGEVHHSVQAVHQAKADRHQRAQHSQHDALDPHTDRKGEDDDLGHHHQGDGEKGAGRRGDLLCCRSTDHRAVDTKGHRSSAHQVAPSG